MALRGTLKDFGIADIFQLIGHQGKTGILHLRNKDQHVRVVFSNGDVIRAEQTGRARKDLLGSIMVRAEALTNDELTEALGIQQTTLKRLGDILVEREYITQETLQEFTKLQSTETIYRLFLWSTGTYEFEAVEVEFDGTLVAPLRAEAILMEGFRMVDEWPKVRKVISGYDLTFERLKGLDEDGVAEEAGEAGEAAADDDFGDLDAAFGDFDEFDDKDDRPCKVSSSQRLIYQLAMPDRDVQKIIDLSRLGEFETCTALHALVIAGFFKISAKRHTPTSESLVGGIGARPRQSRLAVVGRVAIYLLLVVATLLTIKYTATARFEVFTPPAFEDYRELALEDSISRVHLGRVQQALDMYYLAYGLYPAALDDLVRAGLLSERDMRYPWHERYYYRRTGKEPRRFWLDPTPQRPFILLRPVR